MMHVVLWVCLCVSVCVCGPGGQARSLVDGLMMMSCGVCRVWSITGGWKRPCCLLHTLSPSCFRPQFPPPLPQRERNHRGGEVQRKAKRDLIHVSTNWTMIAACIQPTPMRPAMAMDPFPPFSPQALSSPQTCIRLTTGFRLAPFGKRVWTRWASLLLSGLRLLE